MPDNFPKGEPAYFSTPACTPFSGASYGTALPQAPSFHRHSLTLFGYKELDLTLAKTRELPIYMTSSTISAVEISAPLWALALGARSSL